MKVGILGCGMIVNSALQTMMEMDSVECVAIWSREEDKAMLGTLAMKYDVGMVYTDIDAFLADDSYDIVYIGLINSVHYEYTKKVIEAGKHVICEKPFTSTYWQAKDLLKLAKLKNVFLFEAIMLRYLDNYYAIQKALPELGDIKIIQCNYSQYSSRYNKYVEGNVLPAFDPQLSGGSLYDINVYCIQFVMGLFGAPLTVSYSANLGYNGIDTSGILLLDYDTYKAVCVGAKDSDSPPKCTIQGTKGYINMDSMPGIVKDINLQIKGEKLQRLDVVDVELPMQNEFSKIQNILKKQNFDLAYDYMETTLKVMQVLEKARHDAGIVFPADRKES